MNEVNLSKVLIRDTVLLDVEPFTDKETMFETLAAKFEAAGIVTDAIYQSAGGKGNPGFHLYGKHDCTAAWQMRCCSKTGDRLLPLQADIPLLLP